MSSPRKSAEERAKRHVDRMSRGPDLPPMDAPRDHDAAMRIADAWEKGEALDNDERTLARAYKDVVRERDALRQFAEKVLNAECWGRVLDGGDLQDKAEKLGLIVEVPADAEFRDEYDADTMFVCAWSIAARAATTKEAE